MPKAVGGRRHLRALILATAASLFGLAALGPALSVGKLAPATIQYPTGEFTVNCTSLGQLCEPPFQQTVQVPSGGRVTSVAYTAPAGHCSPVRIHVLLDGTEIGSTDFLDPNESSELALFSDPIRKGSVVLGYRAEGRVGGCNAGLLLSWGGSIVTTVTPKCKGKLATILGTDGADKLSGTPAADVIVPLGGNDKVSGLAGNDTICGGAGKDALKGGKGNDKLFGEAGKDTLKGGPGKDKLEGGAGKGQADPVGVAPHEKCCFPWRVLNKVPRREGPLPTLRAHQQSASHRPRP